MKKCLLVLALVLICLPVSAEAQQSDGNGARVKFFNVSAPFSREHVDLYVDGELLLEDVRPLFVSPWYSYDVSTDLTVRIVPTGEDSGNTLANPLGVEMQAGHDYAVVYAWRGGPPFTEVGDWRTDVFDLTALGLHPSATVSASYVINRIEQSDGIDIGVNNEVITTVAPGEIGVYATPLEPYLLQVVDAASQTIMFTSSQGFGEPYYSSLLICDGEAVGELNADYGFGWDQWVDADVITYLTALSGLGVSDFTFNTFVQAADAAQLNSMFSEMDENNIIIVPNDAAFAAMAADLGVTMDAFLSDADALKEMLLDHIVVLPEGELPPFPPPADAVESVFETMMGNEVTIFSGGASAPMINNIVPLNVIDTYSGQLWLINAMVSGG